MNFVRANIPEVIICEPLVHNDKRGYFLESFRQDKLDEYLGFRVSFCQDNESKSTKGVLRGLHFQSPPYAQTKLVRVIEGRVLDVAVDIRVGSPTFGHHVAIELSSDNKKQMLIPRGFAHGFLVLSDSAIFSYKVDNLYSLEHESGIAYNDEELGIDWRFQREEIKVSDKDAQLPSMKHASFLFNSDFNYYV